MNKLKNTFNAIIVIGAMIFLFTTCKQTLVVVQTHTPEEITNTSAVFRGQMSLKSDTVKVKEFGVCWSKKAYPTVTDAHYATQDLSLPYMVRKISDLEEDVVYHVRAYAVTATDIVYGKEYAFKTSSPYDFVDFRLPSGTLWSTRNIGAKHPEQFGSYFKWSNGDNATANWGIDWCVPTEEQWRELYKYTTCEEAFINGVKGKSFSRNGKMIFIPYAGYYSEDSHLQNRNATGDYWTRKTVKDQKYAKCINISADNKHIVDSCFRSYRQPIRPVRSEE